MRIGYSYLCLRTKFQKSPKALVTKDVRETLQPAWLMPQGMVISLEMKETEMGDRGSKSSLNSIKLVKEQRVDGFSDIDIYIHISNCKVYSSHRETGSWEK